LKMSINSKVVKFEKLEVYYKNYKSRIASLKTLVDAFDEETMDIVAILKVTTFHTIALEQICMLMIAKLEILRKEAYFVVFGVKSFKYHKNDDSPLFVPDASPSSILTDVNAYSAISSEYLSTQVNLWANKDKHKYVDVLEVIGLEFGNQIKLMQEIYNRILKKEEEIVGFFKSVKVLKDSFANGKLC